MVNLHKRCCLYCEQQTSSSSFTSTQTALCTSHSQVLSRSYEEKLGEGQRSLLWHGPEMVDTVQTKSTIHTNHVHHSFLVCLLVMIPGLLLIFLHGYRIKSGSGLGMRLLPDVALSTCRAAVGVFQELLHFLAW